MDSPKQNNMNQLMYSQAYKIEENDRIIIVTDGQEYDDFTAVCIMIWKYGKKIKAIVVTGNAFANQGVSMTTLYNLVVMMMGCPHIKIFQGSALSLFDYENDFQDTFRKSVSNEGLTIVDRLYGAINMIPCNKTTKIHYNIEEYAASIDNLVIMCFVTLTDVIDIGRYAKVIYVQGGRFNPEVILPPRSKVKANNIASYNLYLDPHAASIALQRYGDKMFFVSSDASSKIKVDQSLVDNLVEIQRKRCNAGCPSKILAVLIKMYQGMLEGRDSSSLSDVMPVLVAMNPNIVTEMTNNESIVINDQVDLITEFNEEQNTFRTELIFSDRIGGMDLSPDGTLTHLVKDVNADKAYDMFYKIMRRI